MPSVSPKSVVMGAHKSATEADDVSDLQRMTQGLVAGDDEAFRCLEQRYADRLFRYLIVVSRGDEQAARDALQEAFLRVARHARVFDDEERFWRWLAALARSGLRDQHRKHRSYGRALAQYALAWISKRTNGAAERTVAEAEAELRESLGASLKGLEPLDRELVQLKYLENQSMRAIAHEKGMTERAVESRLLRARRRLRDEVLADMKNRQFTLKTTP